MRVKDAARDCAEATCDNGNSFSLAGSNIGYRRQPWPPTTRGLTESTYSNRNNFNAEPDGRTLTYANNTGNVQGCRSIILNQNIDYCSNTEAILNSGDEVVDNCFVDSRNSRNSNIEFCKSTEFFVRVDNVNGTLEEHGGLARSAPSPDESLEYEDIDHCSSATTTPLDDEDRAFEHSDTDDNHSDYDNVHTLPRGIVNPNYPGFQHLAHTLENFTSRGDHNYHSETELTDDDIDINSDQNIGIRNVIESNYYSFRYTEYENNNNNNNNSDIDYTENYVGCVSILDYDKKYAAKISGPEIINRTNNEYENQNYLSDFNSVEDSTKNRLENGDKNNFITIADSLDDNKFLNELPTDNIVGDFETEVVNEFNCIVDRNSNFNDDLVALQIEINETIKKPIEVTIQNVSEVFDTVIEKLVEAQLYDQSDTQEQVTSNEGTEPVDSEKCDIEEKKYEKESTCIDLRNDKPVVHVYDTKDMELSAPSFLCLGNDFEVSIDDAYLSDSKDEITPIAEDNIDDCYSSDTKIYYDFTKCKLKCDLRESPKSESTCTYDNVNQNVSIPITKDTNLNTIEGKQSLVVQKSTQSTVKAEYKPKRNKEKLYETICEKEIDTQLSTADDSEKWKTKKSKEKQEPVTTRNGARPRTADALNRRSVPQTKHTSRSKYSYNSLHGSNVYSLQSTASAVDLDNIENHLRIAKEEDRRRRNDREEIRRRLAMGTDPDDYRSYHVDRPGRKPSLQTRLQSGMNLQICFMNETASDNESPNSDGEGAAGARKLNTSTYSLNDHPYQTRPLSVNIQNESQVGGRVRPSSLSLRATSSRPSQSLGSIALTEADFFARQARLQTEARMALAQAKEMARIQMERDRDSRAISPVTDMLRRSLQKANAPLPLNRRRVSRQILTDMNVAQLQVIVNELHTQIENLNESLVKMLMARDELHMGQDSMLVDIEDLTRYLGAKEQGSKNKPAAKNKSSLPVAQPPSRSILAAPASAIKPKLHRFVSLVRK